jgi:hypothetical protein
MLQRFRKEGRGAGERGAALVEFALILPVLMALVLGMITGGAAYNRQLSLTNAVREGSRFAATLPGGTTWATDVQTRTVEAAGGDLASTNQVCVRLVKSGSVVTPTSSYSALGSECSGVAAPTVTGSDCVVQVWARRLNGDKLQVIFFTSTLSLKANSVARYEKTVTGC